MHDVIFVSMENWDDIWRRNQFICAGLAQRYPDRKILFVGLARNVAHHVRARKVRQLFRKVTWTVPGFPNITVTRPLRAAPDSRAWGRRINEAMSRFHIRRVAGDLGIKDAMLWLNPQYAYHMPGKMGERGVIYDITDDWTAFEQPAQLTQLITQQDAELCRRADAVIVCSQKLYDLKQGLAENLYLIQNGVDTDHYKRVLDDSGPLPKPVANCPGPVLGYTGTIHPDRVDIDLIEALAKRLKQGSIVLVGPILLPEEDFNRLRALKNILFTGPVPYRSLPDYMRAFDVCITPHRMTAFTESLNPIKLWEYLAAGKPIVATNIAGFRDYPQFVYIADDVESFLNAIDKALHEEQTLQQARRNEAKRHSWSARLDEIVEVMQSVVSSR